MGYDLHITRKEYWFDDYSDARDITLSEWYSYIDSDSELELTEEEFKSESGFCEWNAHPLNTSAWLDYSNGDVYTKNTDDPTKIKMLAIAQVLNAKVQGDDGEIYVISRTNEVAIGPLRYGDKDDPYADNK